MLDENWWDNLVEDAADNASYYTHDSFVLIRNRIEYLKESLDRLLGDFEEVKSHLTPIEEQDEIEKGFDEISVLVRPLKDAITRIFPKDD